MSTKELLYIEDALNHAQFLTSQCQMAASQLKDPQLKTEAQNFLDKYKQIFGGFYNLV